MTYFPGNEGKSNMRKFVLLLCCLVSLLLICACVKREMSEKDIADAMKIVKKSDRAIYLDDTQSMIDCANELLNLSKKFARSDDSDYLRQLAFLRLGDAYSYKNDYRKAIEFYDKILAENPYYEIQLIVFQHQITCYSCWRHYKEADEVGRKALKLMDRIREYYRTPVMLNKFLNQYGMIVIFWGSSLFVRREYDEAEKQYLKFLTHFKSEKEMVEIIHHASLIYFNFSQIYHKKRDARKEILYLRKSLLCRKEGTLVETDLYLRLAAYSLREKKYQEALDYCETGIKVKSHFSGRKFKIQHYKMLRAAKEIISSHMASSMKNEKNSSQAYMALSPDLRKQLDWLLFDF